jgi:hypothetical protein
MTKKMAALRPPPPTNPFLSFLSFLPFPSFPSFLPFLSDYLLSPNPFAGYASKSATLTDPISSSPLGAPMTNPCA